MIRAHHFAYQPQDRPGARGLPLFSQNWHPSSLACVLDPQPFDITTPAQSLARQKRDHDAKVLAASITVTPRKPRSRK